MVEAAMVSMLGTVVLGAHNRKIFADQIRAALEAALAAGVK